jgi:hypothetical protein
MRQQSVANKALEAVDERPLVESVDRRRPELSWELARPLVDAAMLLVACFAAVLGAQAAGVSSPPIASLAGFAGLVLILLALRGTTGSASDPSCWRTCAESWPPPRSLR